MEQLVFPPSPMVLFSIQAGDWIRCASTDAFGVVADSWDTQVVKVTQKWITTDHEDRYSRKTGIVYGGAGMRCPDYIAAVIHEGEPVHTPVKIEMERVGPYRRPAAFTVDWDETDGPAGLEQAIGRAVARALRAPQFVVRITPTGGVFVEEGSLGVGVWERA